MSRKRGAGTDVVFRQWCVLRALPRHPRKTTTSSLVDAIMSRYDVKAAIRDVQRDLVALVEHFPLDVDKSTVPHRWGWLRGANASAIPSMDTPTAVAFAVLESAGSRMLPVAMLHGLEKHIETAHKTLKADKFDKRWMVKVKAFDRSWPREAPVADPKVIAVVHDGLLRDLKVEIAYAGKAASEAEAARTVSPVALVHRGASSSLVAWDGTAIKHFRLDRISAARLTTEPASRVSNESREGEISRVRRGGKAFSVAPVRVEIAFDHDASVTVAEEPFGDRQRILRTRKDGWTVFEAQIEEDALLFRSWLLSFGASAVVIKPKDMRDWMEAQAKLAARRYGLSR